jgi:hypothetical protein
VVRGFCVQKEELSGFLEKTIGVGRRWEVQEVNSYTAKALRGSLDERDIQWYSVLFVLDPVSKGYGPSAENHLLHLSNQKENHMKLSAPKNITWWIAVGLGVVGFLGNFMALGSLSFWLLFLGFALLAVATMIDGL